MRRFTCARVMQGQEPGGGSDEDEEWEEEGEASAEGPSLLDALD